MQHLALQVHFLNHVAVHDGDVPHAGGSQVRQRGRAQPAGANHDDAAGQQAFLPALPQAGDVDVAAVAPPLVIG